MFFELLELILLCVKHLSQIAIFTQKVHFSCRNTRFAEKIAFLLQFYSEKPPTYTAQTAIFRSESTILSVLVFSLFFEKCPPTLLAGYRRVRVLEFLIRA